MRYVVSYPRLSRITRKKGTGYLRFRSLDDWLAFCRAAAPLVAPFFAGALPRPTGAAAFLVFAAAGRLVLVFAAGAARLNAFEDRSSVSRAFASDARALRWTSANRI
jgi:hypothetical protein